MKGKLRELLRKESYLGSEVPEATADEAGEAEIYEAMYEAHARRHGNETVVGDLSFGKYELEVVKMAGLKPMSTVVDLGCGIGRLACELVPWLKGGHYIGTDVSPSMLERAGPRVKEAAPSPPCRVTWIKQSGTTFPLDDKSVDMFCAFSVFTNLEQEDSYNFLKDARRSIRSGGRFVYSCMTIDDDSAKNIFLASAQLDFASRWVSVRNVVSSYSLMDSIAEMAGWKPIRWIRASEKCLTDSEGRKIAFGQSICFLAPAYESPWD